MNCITAKDLEGKFSIGPQISEKPRSEWPFTQGLVKAKVATKTTTLQKLLVHMILRVSVLGILLIIVQLNQLTSN